MRRLDPNLAVAERVDAACDRFEREWRDGARPRVEDYVAAALETDRDELRGQLLALEQELQGRSETDTSAARSSVRDKQSLDTAIIANQIEIRDSSPRTIGRFEIHGLLGQGGFGLVYRAYDPQLGREVAIKVPLDTSLVTADDRERFLKEARAAATINHPNVCQIHEVGEHEGQPYIVMALAPGMSLAEYLKSRVEPLAEQQAAQIVRQVGVALAAAHDKGIVHRDLKPANIMFDHERNAVMVMDFGLARGPRVEDTRGTHSGVVMGTPSYMSPEQASGGSRDVGPAGDVYSLGVIFYELLTGRRPFLGTATEVIGQILHVPPEKPSQRRPSVAPRLEAICLKALAKRPEERFASMQEFTAAIDAALVKPRTQRSVFKAVGLALAFGLTLLGGIIFFTRSNKLNVDLMVMLKDVDLEDQTLSVYLRERLLSTHTLANPVELQPGVHILEVKRGKEVVKRLELRVQGGRSPSIKAKEIATSKSSGSPREINVDRDRAAAEWAIGCGGRAAVAVGDQVAVQILKQSDLPSEPFRLTEVGFGGPTPVSVPDAKFDRLAGLKHLEFVHLSGCPNGDEALSHLADCPKLKKLQLDATKVTDEGLRRLSAVSSIEEIYLSGTVVTGTGFADWKNSRLRVLVLNPNLTDDGANALLALKDLRTFSAENSKLTNAGVKSLTRLNLTHLTLSAPEATDIGLVAISQRATLTQLSLLDFPRATPNGMKAIASMPNLVGLTLGGDWVTDEVLSRLSSTNLTDLRFWPKASRVTDVGIREICAIKTLRELQLSGVPVTDACVPDLLATGLDFLSLSGSKISKEGLRKLQRGIPRSELTPEPK